MLVGFFVCAFSYAFSVKVIKNQMHASSHWLCELMNQH